MSEDWVDRSIDELCDLYDHLRIPLNSRERALRSGPYPYYGAQGIVDWIDDYRFEGRYILVPEDGANLTTRKLPIAFFATGKFWVNNHAHVLRAKAYCADDVFIKHAINSLNISGYVTGAAQPKLSQANLKLITLPVPPLPTQRRIAAILSAYDDLIEVNTRRIAILEEMARRVYEEWFGSEVGESNQIPLRDLCGGEGLIQTGPFGSQLHQREYEESGVPVVMPKNISAGRIDTAGCAKVSQATANRLARHKAQPGDLLFARRGEVGRFALVRDFDGEVLCGTGCLLVRPDRSFTSPHYLARYFERTEVAASLEARAVGSTMANLNTAILGDTLIRTGLPEMVKKYDEKAGLIDKATGVMARMNANLRAQRDLLLPRLVSGKLSVDDAERQVEEDAA